MELLQFGFNQDKGCFACGSTTGFRVFNCEPFEEKVLPTPYSVEDCILVLGLWEADWLTNQTSVQCRRDFNGAGVAMVELLFRCNLFALVGGGPTPRFSPNKVRLSLLRPLLFVGSFRPELVVGVQGRSSDAWTVHAELGSSSRLWLCLAGDDMG